MKILWLVAGIAIGAAVAKQVQENPQARKAYEEVKSSLQEFGDAVTEGYRERESELSKSAKKSPSKTSSKSGSKTAARPAKKSSVSKPKPASK